MSHRRRPPASAMRYRSSKAISFMKPRVLRLAVLASRTLSGSSSENVSVGRLSAKSSLDGRDEVAADRAEIRATNACPEDGEQRAGVCEQETLLPGDPEQVQKPVVVGRREFAERE
jgi:hypothetical protein